ncbi:MAG TPA: TetR/AcrR family transcriptional regulator [Sporichthyaceae bacterium]|jgi:AcrR family transcriptional regulator|nr:TetR/AcrR family transcriptional regulator [Sporichthyaceae bacterium]
MDNSSPRERILATAGELFYRDGIASVAVGRIIEEADVGHMSLWRIFGSKQGLVDAWLRQTDETMRAEACAAFQAALPPRDRIAALFDVYTRWSTGPWSLGCPLVKAAAEPGGAGPEVRTVAAQHKWTIRDHLHSTCLEAGAADPHTLAAQLLYLIDGLGVSAGLGLPDNPPHAARAAALTLFDAATRGRAGRPSSSRPAGRKDGNSQGRVIKG